ncbi:hypothetical protein T4C_660 [Trichinella pseudospiralis]|uniref:Uncharacterized protein n=1 Tax=Trichinella pseudospiralis TaxID=6337 RepID=A0A0V1K503_TRIPS|nr:hypothetical protein T4C_660 [Trichinella pseudospiralis]
MSLVLLLRGGLTFARRGHTTIFVITSEYDFDHCCSNLCSDPNSFYTGYTCPLLSNSKNKT